MRRPHLRPQKPTRQQLYTLTYTESCTLLVRALPAKLKISTALLQPAQLSLTFLPTTPTNPAPGALASTIPHLVAVKRPPSTIRMLAPPRHNVHHPLGFVSRAKAGPLPLEPVAGLPLAVRGRAATASHVDHDGRLVKRAELCLLSLL